ncbi:MAG: CapA family protein [Clostridia bacterium]|nr:CapA family protein [Clostridia bacterium]
MQYPKIKHTIQKILTLSLAALTLSSCGIIEMREATVEYPETNNTAAGLLTPAARAAEDAEERVTEFVYTDEPEDEGPVPVTFTLAGDILVDTFIISDGARRAGAGQSYSFVRMLSGIYQNLSAADVTAGFDTTAARPKNDSDPSHRIPEEMVAVLAEAGYDVLDTLAWNDPAGMLQSYGITPLSTVSEGDAGILVAEEKGLSYAICAAGGEAFPIGAEETLANITSAAERASLVIVLADWDDGMTHDEQCAAAYYMAEAGADVVVGTGDTVGPVDRLATTRGSSCLVAYSLGNILSTGKQWEDILGGILTFTATPGEDGYTVGDPILTPTVVHFTAQKQDYQIVPLSLYNDDLAASHGLSGFTAEGLKGYVRTVIPADYLPKEYRG